MIFFQTSCEMENDLDDVNCSDVSSGYASNIKPIINANCISSGCHNQGSQYGDFTSYSGLKAIADNGLLKFRVLDNRNMPPSGFLSLEELTKIKCWIESGAPNN